PTRSSSASSTTLASISAGWAISPPESLLPSPAGSPRGPKTFSNRGLRSDMAVIRKVKLVPTQPRSRRWGIAGAIAAILLIAVFVGIRPYSRRASHLEDVSFRQPSRLYARATRLFEGRNYPPDLLTAGLADEGYREDKTTPDLPAGRYRRTKQGVDVHLRSFPLPDGSH